MPAIEARLTIEPPLPSASWRARYLPTAVPRPEQVHAHRLLEELVRNSLGHDRRLGRDAGVVDQDVDAAEMLPTGRDHRRDVSRVADVALQGERLVAGRSQPVGDRLHLVERSCRKHEVGARARQSLCKRDAEPIRRAGHQRCLALQREQRVGGHRSQGKGNGGAAFGRVATGGGGGGRPALRGIPLAAVRFAFEVRAGEERSFK